MAKLGDTTVYGSVDAQGIVTRPKQPAFSATLPTPVYIVAVATWYTLAPWTVQVDNNNDFNATTGIFTAPVAGKYQFNTTVDLRSLDTATAYYWVRIATTKDWYGQLLDPNFTADINYRGFSVAILADMDAGDEAWVDIFENAGALNQTYASTVWTGFSGFLAC